MKTLIEMAREAEIEIVNGDGWPNERLILGLKRFAALVRADEREVCAQEADAYASIEGIAQRIATAIRARGQDQMLFDDWEGGFK